MLGGIRAAQSTWLGKALTTLIFGVILIAFVIWGMGDPFRGIGSNSVAQVGDVSVSTAAYRQAYLDALADLQRRARRAVTNEEAHRIGLDAQVLSRLMSEAALDDRAQSLGLAISGPEVAKSVASDFAGPNGTFDRARFDAVLRGRNTSEAAFLRDQGQVVLRQELANALVGGVEAPASALDALHRYEDETRSLDLVEVPASALGAVPPPDGAALQSYYDGHRDAFTSPQYRRLVVLSATPAAAAKPDAVSEADARALYDKLKSQRFAVPEKRHVSEVVFPDEAAAAAFVGRVRAGQSFEEAARADDAGGKAIDLGTVAKDAIFERAVADAAFGLAPDGTSDPVAGRFGSVVLHVDAVEPAAVRSFDEAAPELKAEIARSRAAGAVASLHDRIEELRGSGKSLAEAGTAVGLAADTVPAVAASGDAPDGKPVADLPGGPDLLKAAFASDVGVDNLPLATADGGFVWFEVAQVDPARRLTLDEARDKVTAAWSEDEAARRLDAAVAVLMRDIDAGRQTLEGAAASLGGLPVSHVGDAKRAGAPGLPAGTAARAFDVAVGAAGSAATGPASRTLFKVLDSVTPPLDADADGTKALAQRYNSALQDGMVDDYLGTIGAKLGTKVNQAAVMAASGTSPARE